MRYGVSVLVNAVVCILVKNPLKSYPAQGWGGGVSNMGMLSTALITDRGGIALTAPHTLTALLLVPHLSHFTRGEGFTLGVPACCGLLSGTERTTPGQVASAPPPTPRGPRRQRNPAPGSLQEHV